MLGDQGAGHGDAFERAADGEVVGPDGLPKGSPRGRLASSVHPGVGLRVIHLPDLAGRSPLAGAGLRLLVDASRVVPVDASVAAAVAVEPVADAGFDVLRDRDPFRSAPGVVRIPGSLFEQVGALAAATAEQGSSARDRFGRVPASANPFVAGGVERRPVLSELAVAFRQAIVRAAGDHPFRAVAPWPGGHRWAAVLSHDLDVVAGWPIFTALRVVELLSKFEFGRSSRVVLAAAAAGVDPVTRGISDLLEIEAAGGVRSSWFVLAGMPTIRTWRRGDLTYRPGSKRARGILARIRSGGHEVGLHGSFDTMEDPAEFAVQRDRLAALATRPPIGIRQHFLRMRPMETQRAMADAGFRYDSTFGFADRNGFRLGLADVVPLPGMDDFDLLPFCWMDRALSKYQGIEDPAGWIADGLSLARACRSVDGVWCGIWHPNLVTPLGFPGALDAYRALLAGLRAIDDPWIALAREVVEWRRARRTVRITGVDAAGQVVAIGAETGLGPMWLEDADGVVRERAGAVA